MADKVVDQKKMDEIIMNKQPEAIDVMSIKPETGILATGDLDENEYVQYLCSYANTRTRADTGKPQIPVSSIVSIALTLTGTNTKLMGKFNFWGLDTGAKITTSNQPNQDGKYEFNSASQGINAIIEYCRKEEFKDATAHLKDKMSNSTQTDKENFMQILLLRMDAMYGDDRFKAAKKFIAKHNLYAWDEDKTEAQGGHSDTPSPVSTGDDNAKSGSSPQSKINSAIQKATSALNSGMFGNNVRILTLVPNKYKVANIGMVRIEKLPKNKTLVEPVYPDLITVGDQVPSWIYSQEYVDAYKAAEDKILKEAGFNVEDDNSVRLTAINNQIAGFQEKQFKAWCVANGKSDFTSDDTKQAYQEAAAADTSGSFTEGVYTPDAVSKSTYTSLLQQKKVIDYDSTYSATAQSRIRYQQDLQTVRSEIQQRESGWNQDRGQYTPTQQQEIVMINPDNDSAAATPAYVDTGNNSEGITTGTANAIIEKAVKFAESKIGNSYSQTDRDGPSYDCASLIYYALDAAGFPIIEAWKKNKRYSATGKVTGQGDSATGGYNSEQKVGDVDTLWIDIQKMNEETSDTGWSELSWSSAQSSLQRGDIVASWGNNQGHMFMMRSKDQTVEARDSDSGIGSWPISERIPTYATKKVYRYKPT